MELKIRDVAHLLGVPEKQIHEWIKDKGLPAHRIGGSHRFNRAELLEWATARQVPLAGQIFAQPEAGSARLPDLADALQLGGIFHVEGVSDRPAALRVILQHMPLPEETDREFLLEMFLAREALASTGIGDGIAIPHVRNPVILQVPSAMITLCLLAAPIEFGAVDGKPVHALFSMISPSVKTHLHLLSRLAFALSHPEFKKAITYGTSAEQILAESRRVETGLGPAAPSTTPGVVP
jgi:PTS system nitrogen regulatory IIA component